MVIYLTVFSHLESLDSPLSTTSELPLLEERREAGPRGSSGPTSTEVDSAGRT